MPEPVEQLTHRVGERVHAVGKETGGHGAEVDASGGYICKDGSRGRFAGGECVDDATVVAKGRQGGGRHRIDDGGPHELLDVLYVAVARILGSGRAPRGL